MAQQDVIVELFYDAVWNDITALGHVYARDPIRITHGRGDEDSQSPPSSCTLTLKNVDGRYNPRNPESPLYGKIGRNTPIRVTVGIDTRFVGEAGQWQPRRALHAGDAWIELTANGLSRRLGQGSKPLRSALRRQVPNQSFVKAYWPMEDGPESTSAASPIAGVQPLGILGEVTFAQQAGPGGSDPLPNFDLTGEFRGRIPRMDDDWRVDWLFRTEEAPSGEIVLLLVSTSSADAEHFQVLASSTNLIVRCFDTDSVSVLDQSVALPAGFYGDWIRATLISAQNGADVSVLLAVFRPGETDELASILTGITTADSGSPIRVAVTTATQARQFGHITFSEGGISEDPFAFGADNGYAGETAARRIQRLGGENDVDLALIGDLDETAAMGPQRSGTLLDLLTECADADLGFLTDNPSASGFRYQTREATYNQAATLALDFDAGQVAPPLDVAVDDQQVRNDVTAKRTEGSEARVVDEDGPLGVAAIGRYDVERTVNVVGDGFLPNHAGWLLHLGTVDDDRFPQVTVDLDRAPELADPVGDVRAGNRITLTNLPATIAAAGQASLLVQGWTEDIGSHRRIITFNCTPESPWRPAEYESAAGASVNKYDTAGSELNEALTTTETDVDVLVTVGPLWTADNAEDGFAIIVGGEVMTVTDVAAAVANVHTFTVTRSVNGVVKTHAAGSPVRLYPTPPYAL